jgi:hypothetical protein
MPFLGGAMQIEDLDEPVTVRADFAGGAVTPRAFKRIVGGAGRTYRVTAVNGRWVDREGARPVYHFSVQAEGDTYYLCLTTADMLWRLEKVVVEG